MNPETLRIVKLHAEGRSIRQIASELGVTTYRVRQAIDASLAIVPPPERPGQPAIAFYDIETRPKVGLYFGPEWQTRISKKLTSVEVLTFAYKWEGSDETHVLAAWDVPSWRPGYMEVDQDEWLMKRLWDLYDMADVVVAHNGDKFDQKKAFGRMWKYGMTPPSHFIEVDTLKLGRTFFGLDSHRLDALAKEIGLEGKVSHDGIDLWDGCMLGVEKDQQHMKDYNEVDTILLEEVYQSFEPWIGFNGRGRKFNRALWGEDGVPQCPNCGSFDLKPNGFRETATQRKQSYLCACGARPTERTTAKAKKGVVLN